MKKNVTLENIKIGSRFWTYAIVPTTTNLTETKVDENGDTWYKVPESYYTYQPAEIVIVGKRELIVTGEVSDGYENEFESSIVLFFKYLNDPWNSGEDVVMEFEYSDEEINTLFNTKEEAEAYIDMLEQTEAKELETGDA